MRFNVWVLFIFFLIFSFLEPEYFTTISMLHLGFMAIRYISLLLIIPILIRIKKIPIVSLLILAYYFSYLFSTYINNGDVFNLISTAIPIIGLILWTEVLLNINAKVTIKSLYITYSSIVYMNIIFFLIFPNGYIQIYSESSVITRYFIGVYNQFPVYLIPAIIIGVVYSLSEQNRIAKHVHILIIASIFTVTYFWSATSIIGIMLLVLYVLVYKRKWVMYFINSKVIVIIYCIIFFIIVIINNLSIFSYFIENVLGKDLTLSTRTRIWNIAIEMIKEKPILGYGYLEGGKYVYITSAIQRNAHNMILQIILQSGILGLVILSVQVKLFFNRLSHNKSNPISKFLLVSLFISMIMMLSEVYTLHYLFMILLLGVYSPDIIRNQETLKKVSNER